jgi:hypothetical protein
MEKVFERESNDGTTIEVFLTATGLHLDETVDDTRETVFCPNAEDVYVYLAEMSDDMAVEWFYAARRKGIDVSRIEV